MSWEISTEADIGQLLVETAGTPFSSWRRFDQLWRFWRSVSNWRRSSLILSFASRSLKKASKEVREASLWESWAALESSWVESY